MTIAQLGQRLRRTWNHIALAFWWKVLKMAFEKVQAQIDEIMAALARAQSDKDGVSAKEAADAKTIADLQQQLSDAEAQIVALLQPAVTAANNLAPPPAPAEPLAATAALANAVVGQAYSGSISISGGTAPYHVSSVPPSDNGITVNADGSVTGDPVAAATSSFEVTVEDSATPPASVTIPVSLTAA